MGWKRNPWVGKGTHEVGKGTHEVGKKKKKKRRTWVGNGSHGLAGNAVKTDPPKHVQTAILKTVSASLSNLHPHRKQMPARSLIVSELIIRKNARPVFDAELI